jgi:diguanylate cyclase (GGDEF)-like protein
MWRAGCSARFAVVIGCSAGGGEEFLILMPGCGAAQAIERGEALRQALRSEPIHLPANPTICCGVTTFRPGETDQELLLRADQALYRAKRKGRDRVVCLDQGEAPEPVARSAASA